MKTVFAFLAFQLNDELQELICFDVNMDKDITLVYRFKSIFMFFSISIERTTILFQLLSGIGRTDAFVMATMSDTY